MRRHPLDAGMDWAIARVDAGVRPLSTRNACRIPTTLVVRQGGRRKYEIFAIERPRTSAVADVRNL